MARPDGSYLCNGKLVKPPQQSIHPRVRNGVTVFPKVNTAKAKKGSK